MIGLDTNVLVRYFTQDDPGQSAIANQLIESRCSRSSPGYINHIVLCELVWVLRRAYGYDKAQLVALLDQILITAELDIENEALAWKALASWRSESADYSDYLLALVNLAGGCETTYSFDRKLTRYPAVTLAK